MNDLDVSIVVPFYNEERHIEGCLQSLMRLEYPPERFEILCIDNNSTDRSAEIVRRYPRVRLLSETERGDFAARNRGLAEARGSVIAFTDSDTAPLPDWLTRIMAAMEDPAVGVIVGKLEFGPRSRALRLMADYEAAKNEYIFASEVPEIYYGYTCNLAARRSLFEELGPFPRIYRNADVAFVRAVVDRHSCGAVIFGRDVRVQRLEVATLGQYLAKAHIYGRDLRNYQAVANARPLNSRERLAVFRSAVRRFGYGPFRAAALLGLLVLGVVFYETGRLRSQRR